MSAGRKLTETELRVLELASFGQGRKPVSDDDIPARNGEDLWGDVIPGRRAWNAMVAAGLVYLPIEDPITLDDGSPFTFTAFYELTDRGEAARRSGTMPPAADQD
ncbi:hypothetical protein [Paracoccus sp. ME4]|uniref:hypothetical protein n=1 Tax=Paracoccus sp. ME4 TaxID=3138066 RepID=UPI00398A53B6